MDQFAIDTLKQRARQLQREAQAGDGAALRRLRRLPELRSLDDAAVVAALQRRHCLSVLARELGLHGWSHLTALWNATEERDFGTLLYPSSCGGGQNVWCASYEEARAIRDAHRGFLLPYRHQMVIVDRYFIADLGVDADDADWTRIGRDWIRPADKAARNRLLREVVQARLRS